MSTVTAILRPDADGTLRRPVPEELRAGPVNVTATLEPADEPGQDVATPKPDFAAIRERLWGDNRDRRPLTAEDSAFIRDRGDR